MQSVKLNLIPGAVLPVVNVSQYDVKRTFALAVYDGAASYDLTGKTVTIRGTKPDNHGFDYGTADGVVSVSGNTVTISTTQQMTAVGGHVLAELRIESGTTVIGTLNFIIDVEPSALSDDTILSDTEIPVIERSAWEQVEQAEKWATGAHDGTPVGPSEPQFENSAKWWAQHASTLGGLTDVDIESPTNDQVLKYDSATQKWKNSNGGGGASALDDLTDVTITTPASGDGLLYDGSKWVNGAVATPTQLAAKLDVTAQQQLGAWNLLPNESSTLTDYGVTYTDNSDGTVTITGTSTKNYSQFQVYGELHLPAGTYYLSSGAVVPDGVYWSVQKSNNSWVDVTGFKSEVKFTLAEGEYIKKARIAVANGKTPGITIKPMISLQPNMPYVPRVMTNRELSTIEDITSELSYASGITSRSDWTKIVRCGKTVTGTLRFTTPSTVSDSAPIMSVPAKYAPSSKYKVSAGFAMLGPLYQIWSGEAAGVLVWYNNNYIMGGSDWQAGKQSIVQFSYLID